jgi:hypothetical protein
MTEGTGDCDERHDEGTCHCEERRDKGTCHCEARDDEGRCHCEERRDEACPELVEGQSRYERYVRHEIATAPSAARDDSLRSGDYWRLSPSSGRSLR